MRLYKIAHVALYFGIFGPWGFFATFICDASRRTGWLGRRDSNLCILESEFAKTSQPGGRDSNLRISN